MLHCIFGCLLIDDFLAQFWTSSMQHIISSQVWPCIFVARCFVVPAYFGHIKAFHMKTVWYSLLPNSLLWYVYVLCVLVHYLLAARVYSQAFPYHARLSSNDRVTAADHFQDVRLIRLDTSSADQGCLKYVWTLKQEVHLLPYCLLGASSPLQKYCI